MRPDAYRVHGMMQSYFTRKVTGYLDYKGIPWVFRRFAGASPEAMAAGFTGGVPAVETPAGEFMWDSTAMIHYIELRYPEPSVLPAEPVQRFVRKISTQRFTPATGPATLCGVFVQTGGNGLPTRIDPVRAGGRLKPSRPEI